MSTDCQVAFEDNKHNKVIEQWWDENKDILLTAWDLNKVDHIFKCIFLKYIYILIQITLVFASWGLAECKSALLWHKIIIISIDHMLILAMDS